MVIQTAFLGDVVLTTPLLAALAERHGPVDVVTTPAAASSLDTHPAVRQVIPFDKNGKDRGWLGGIRMAGQLRRQGYTRAYLPHRSWRSGALALVARIPERIGFADRGALLLTPRKASARGVATRSSGCSPWPTAAVGHPPVSLALTAADHADAERWLAAHEMRPGFVALAPGSIWGTKRWPYYAELAAGLGRPLVVVGGSGRSRLAEEPIVAGGAWPRWQRGRIARSSSLGGADSAGRGAGDQRLGAAASGDRGGTPVVAIFGPTVPGIRFSALGDARTWSSNWTSRLLPTLLQPRGLSPARWVTTGA